MTSLIEHQNPVVIRLATPDDRSSLGLLAELDSREVPAGATLIAEQQGRPVAALSMTNGEVIADPFVPTREVLELLRLRAGQLTPRLAPHGFSARPRSMRRPPTRSRRPLWR